MLCDTGKHSGADFLAIVEGEDDIRPSRPGEDAMRTGLALHRPADAQERSEDQPGLG